MAVIGRAQVLVTPSFKGLQKAVATGTAPAASSGGKTFGSTFGKWAKRGAAVGAAAVGTVLTGALVKGFSRLRAIEEAQAKLRGLGHDAKSVEAIMKNALASVKGTSFGMGEAATVAASMVAAGIKPGAELERVLKSVANSASAAGTGMDEMGAIYGKVASLGKAQNDSLQQVADKGIPIYQTLADQMGVTTEEIFKMASAGEISFADFEKAMKSASGTVAKEMGETFTGRLSNAWAALGRVGANLLSGIFPMLASGLGKITDALGPLEDKAAVLGKALGAGLSTAVSQGSAALGWMSDAMSGLVSLIRDGDFTGNLRKAFGWSEDSAAVDFLFRVRDAFISAKETVSSFAAAALPHIKQFGQGMLDAVKAAGPLVQSIGKTLVSAFQAARPYLVTAAAVLGGTLYVAMKALPPVVTAVFKALTWLLDTIRPALPALAGLAAGIFAVRGAMAAVKMGKAAIDMLKYAKAVALFNARAAVWYARTIAVGVAQKAVAIGTKAWAVAQRILNAAMRANPIGLIITGLMLLVGGLVLAYKKSETFRNIVNGAWAGIKKAASVVVNWFTGTALPFMQKVFTGISDAASWLWNGIKSIFNRFKPLFIGLAAVAAIAMGPLGIAGAFVVAYKKSETFRNIVQTVVGAVVGFVQRLWAGVKTAFAAISNAFTAVGNTFRRIWSGYLSPVFQLIGAIVKWLAVKIFKAHVAIIQRVWNTFAAVFRKAYNSIIKPVINFFAKAIQGWKIAISAAIRAVQRVWSAMGTAIRSIYNRHLKPIVDAFKRIVAAMRTSIRAQVNAVKSVWSGMGSAVRSTYNKHLKPIVDALKSKIKTVKDAFKTAVDGVKTQWDKLKGIAKAPVRFVVNTVINGGLIAGFNKLARAFGTSEMSKVSLPKGFDGGGWTGPGAKMKPAGVVHADEFVISKAARRSIEKKHPGLLNHMLLYGDVPGYDKGGRVWPVKGSRAWTTYAGHTGIDFPRGMGTPVFATEDGTIQRAAKLATSYGWHYFLKGKSGITTIYAHLSKMLAKMGQKVRAGNQIGNVGSTGNSTGPHLHFETRPGGSPGAASGYLGGAGAPKGGIISSAISKVMGAFSSVKDWLVSKFSGPLDKLKEITGSPFGRLAAGLPRKIKGDLIDYAVDKMSFDSGGMLQPGYTLAYNGTRRPEPVFTAKQFDGMQSGGPQRMVGELVLKNGKAYIEGIVSDVAADALTARSY